MQMDVGLDTGNMRGIQSTPIGGKTGGGLTAELAEMGADLLVDVLASLDNHPRIPQPDKGVTYAAKIDKAESRIDFTRPAVEIERQVRAFAPAPGAFFEYQGERFRILAAECLKSSGRAGEVIDAQLTIACGVGALRPILIQRAGKSAMSPADLLRGFSPPPGTRLG